MLLRVWNGCGTDVHACKHYDFNISPVQPEQGELRFPPREKKQGAAKLHSVKLCVSVVTTVTEINDRFTPHIRNNKQAPNITLKFGLQGSQIFTDGV